MRLHIHSSIEYNMHGVASRVYYLRRIFVTVHTVASDSVSRQNISFDLSYIRSTTTSRNERRREDETVAGIAVPRLPNRQPGGSEDSNGMRNRETARTS